MLDYTLNKGLVFAVSLLWLLFIVCCNSSVDNSPGNTDVTEKVLKISHSSSADFSSELHTTAWLFQQYVNDHSTSLSVKIYPSNSLGQEREVYEGMQLGSGATGVVSGTAILNNFVPKIGVLDLPFLWKDYEHVHSVMDGGVGKELENELADAGLKLLAWLDSWGYRHVITSEKTIKQTQDLSGLKIRTIQTPVYIETINMMGANATPMPFGEVYTGMQTGVLDGFEHSPAMVKANNLYEVAENIALTHHLFGVLVFAISQKEWESYTSEQQNLIQEAATFARNIQRAQAPIKEREALAFLSAHGMNITEINTEIFRSKALDLQNEIAKQIEAVHLLNEIRSAAN